MLTERERWLMQIAWHHSGSYGSMAEWLDDIAADGGITVEQVLLKDAPTDVASAEDSRRREVFNQIAGAIITKKYTHALALAIGELPDDDTASNRQEKS